MTKSMARTTTHGKRNLRKQRMSRRTSVAAMRSFLESTEPNKVPSRADIRTAPPRSRHAEGLAAASVVLSFVAIVSHDGPWELRSLVVNDFQVLDKTVATSERRIDILIPSVLRPPLKVAWAIIAGHLIPTIATFIAQAGSAPVELASKAPLKKGESWAPLAASRFPPE